MLDYECYYLKLLPFSSGCKNTQTNPSIKRDNNPFACCGIWIIFILNHF
ncbi:hypothetical protein HPHPP8B_0479 [Helicobacter pylori Hp P-8b]|nr:hypothetical protein HPHPP8_0480 [Helicobacter pylori Hp P-8]EJC27924.1 hypothetical protein HPHPP8B_0479 [Helicobacter pylori Hp P-8b]